MSAEHAVGRSGNFSRYGCWVFPLERAVIFFNQTRVVTTGKPHTVKI